MHLLTLIHIFCNCLWLKGSGLMALGFIYIFINLNASLIKDAKSPNELLPWIQNQRFYPP